MDYQKNLSKNKGISKKPSNLFSKAEELKMAQDYEENMLMVFTKLIQ